MAVVLLGLVMLAAVIRARQVHKWMGGYLRHITRGRVTPDGQLIQLFICIADHFEPAWGGASMHVQRARVREWTTRYPALARRHRDSVGRPYRHTFFFPAEEYVAEHLDCLADFRQQGIADVEVHLHHDNDTAEALRGMLTDYARLLHDRHALLRRDGQTDRVMYGFVHGNWALDNSRSDGRWCGVNSELSVLSETGCYADFTYPSAPSETQPRTINSIYYAIDDPNRPKSHDRGIHAQVGGDGQTGLLLVQGPLSLSWQQRKWGLFPRIENGELSGDALPTPNRIETWVRQHIHVRGRPDWVFVKLHTHGAQEENLEMLLGKPMDAMLSHLEAAYNDGVRYALHYVTAWEMYRAIKAAERGVSDPAEI